MAFSSSISATISHARLTLGLALAAGLLLCLLSGWLTAVGSAGRAESGHSMRTGGIRWESFVAATHREPVAVRGDRAM